MSEDSPVLHVDDIIKTASYTLLSVVTSAERLEDDTIGRLAINTSAACDGIASSVRDTVTVVSDALRAVGLKAKSLCNLRDKRLEWQYDELDAIQAQLESVDRQLRAFIYESDDINVISESVRTTELLLAEFDAIPRQPSAVWALSACIASALSVMSYIQLCVDCVRSGVSHARYLKRGEGNSVTIACRDACGEAVRTLATSDVRVSLSEPLISCNINRVSVDGGSVVVEVWISGADVPNLVTLLVDISGTAMQVPLQVCVLS